MSRIRTVKPELFRHEGLFEAEQQYNLPLRLAFIGLLTVSDREGRFRWQPRVLKLDVLPHDAIDFGLVLEALAASGFIIKYEHQGEVYGAIPTWRKHQRINCNERKSILPDHKLCMQPPAENKNARAFTLPASTINVQKNASSFEVVNVAENDNSLAEAPLADVTITATPPFEPDSCEATPDMGSSAFEEQCTLMHVHSPYDDINAYQEKEEERELEKEKERERKDVSVELAQDATSTPTSDVVITLPLVGNKEWVVHQRQVEEWQQLYPAIDVVQVLRHIKGWNLANPKRRKTKSGILRHVTSWLAKEQDRGGIDVMPGGLPKAPGKHMSLYEHNLEVGRQWLAQQRVINGEAVPCT